MSYVPYVCSPRQLQKEMSSATNGFFVLLWGCSLSSQSLWIFSFLIKQSSCLCQTKNPIYSFPLPLCNLVLNIVDINSTPFVISNECPEFWLLNPKCATFLFRNIVLDIADNLLFLTSNNSSYAHMIDKNQQLWQTFLKIWNLRVCRSLRGQVGLSSARAAKKLKRRRRTNRCSSFLLSLSLQQDKDIFGHGRALKVSFGLPLC